MGKRVIANIASPRDLAGCCHASHGWLCLLQPIADLPWERTPVLMVTVLDDQMRLSERLQWARPITSRKPIPWAVLRHRVICSSNPCSLNS